MGKIFLFFLTILAGIFAGIIFFGGLWYTVSRLAIVSKPKLFFLQSYLLRTASAFVLFYLATKFELLRVLIFSIGFLAVRIILVQRFSDSDRKKEVG